ncbi:protein S100-A13-like [Eucyclogobius newberryi]|uniref:protein S100-A13-like n=1 Tax=Eucyclogobius newberryi TaxID=166745 RepID=UPI003B5C1A16
MEAAIAELVSKFRLYAGAEGSSSTLSRDEFHKLVTTELPNLVENNDSSAVDRLMKSRDADGDGQLDFSEFWQLIGRLADERGGSGQ